MEADLFVPPAFVPPTDGFARAKELLHTVFGYSEFRARQAEIIKHVIEGKHAVVLMPTGGGKSLCYQIPALVRDGVGIVVSPLIALMKDQVDALKQAGVRAAYLNSSLSLQECRAIEDGIRLNQFDLVYVAPERVMTESFQSLLSTTRVALFAIDEAHCVSQWGHNFRPEYAELSVLHKTYPNVPLIALTATADRPTRKDIFERLALSDATLFASGFDRPNIHYRVVDKDDARNQLLNFIRSEFPRDSGIIYCQTRNKVEETATWLTKQGISALPYHAGIDSAVKNKHHRRFITEEGIVIVATIAFGMGIDKPNVRFVAHLDVPRSLEAYYQETGRAGRDGLPAIAWMTYGLAEVIETKYKIMSSELDERQKRIELQKFEALLGYCETVNCRRAVLLTYFGDQPKLRCDNCDLCLTPVKTWDGTTAAQKAMSAVYRTGQKFGVGYLADVLMGKLTDRVKQWEHDQLKTFGVGKDLNKNQWSAIFRQLVAAGHLTVDLEGHGGLKLNKASMSILKGEQQVFFREQPKVKATGKQATDKSSRGTLQPDDEDLWQALREKRLILSKDQNVPPYVIFHDTTLLQMVAKKPRSLREFANLPGVGDTKLERYGQIFIDVIADFL